MTTQVSFSKATKPITRTPPHDLISSLITSQWPRHQYRELWGLSFNMNWGKDKHPHGSKGMCSYLWLWWPWGGEAARAEPSPMMARGKGSSPAQSVHLKKEFQAPRDIQQWVNHALNAGRSFQAWWPRSLFPALPPCSCGRWQPLYLHRALQMAPLASPFLRHCSQVSGSILRSPLVALDCL